MEQIESAKAVCRHCEARAACLEYALATNQESGIWGGTSEVERLKLRKARLALNAEPRPEFHQGMFGMAAVVVK